MKPTFQYSHGNRISMHLRDGVLPAMNYKVLKTLHTETVKAVRNRRKPNRVLSTPPPEIHPSESELPRRHRTVLSQLRSDWCKDLKSYQKLIRKAPDDLCPECGMAPQFTQHLFSCPSTPTLLSKSDLWERHREAVYFVSSLAFFSYLPPLAPPSPGPRRSLLLWGGRVSRLAAMWRPCPAPLESPAFC
jgi:hypothetical protein